MDRLGPILKSTDGLYFTNPATVLEEENGLPVERTVFRVISRLKPRCSWLAYFDHYLADGRLGPIRPLIIQLARNTFAEDPRWAKAQYNGGTSDILTCAEVLWIGENWRSNVVFFRSTNGLQSFEIIRPRGLPEQNKDGVLFPSRINGRHVLLDRPFPVIGWATSADDLRTFTHHGVLLAPTDDVWQSRHIGGGSTPIKLKDDRWLIFYHGVDEALTYSMGAAVIEFRGDTPVVIARTTKRPLLAPEERYETESWTGKKIVFPTSAYLNGNAVTVCYGGADSSICRASGNLEEIYDSMEWFSP